MATQKTNIKMIEVILQEETYLLNIVLFWQMVPFSPKWLAAM